MTWPEYSAACRKEVNALLKKGGSLSAYRASSAFPKWIGPKEGSQAWKLEREIERKFQVKHAIAVNSGTAALHAALAALGVEGKEVVTTPYSFSATASAIILAGGIPRFADVDDGNFCITKETVKNALTKRTAAILPVHLFGGLADIQGLMEFGLPVIEDTCQAVGARFSTSGNPYSGTQGIAGVYSFNGSKNIPAGEGGCLVTNSDKIAEKARLFCNHFENFGSQEVGYNYRIHEVVALIARHGLLALEERNQRRIDLVSELRCGLMSGKLLAECLYEGWWGPEALDGSHVFYVTPFRNLKITNEDSRSHFIKRMARHGIPIQAGYTQPLHTLPAFRKYQTTPLPVVEEVHRKLCLLTTLTPDREISYSRKVAKAIRESLS